MSGHSKWSTIKRKKAVVDAKRSKVWTKVVKEITVSVRTGGSPDPDANPRLRLALVKAKSANLPKDAIKRAIDKGAGAHGGADWEDVTYEGYGPGGVAVVVDCMTDNRNRTVAEVRRAFDKHGGKMAQTGAVGWMFKKRGQIHVLKADVGEEQLMDVALEAGAEDVQDEGDAWLVDTESTAFLGVQDALKQAGITLANAEIDAIPDTRVELDDDKGESVLKMIAMLEDCDDVQDVYSNHVVSEELLDRFDG